MTQQSEEMAQELETPAAVPVHIPHSVDTQPQAADFGAFTAYHFAGTEQPVMALPYDSYRHRAVLMVTPPAGTYTSATTEGSQTSPGAATTITSQALGGGSYSVQWGVQLGGTVATVDANNFGLYNGASLVATSLNSGVAGTYPQPAEVVAVASGGATLAVKAIGNATSGAIYNAQLTSAQQAQGLVYVGTQAQCLTKTAGVILVGQSVTLENNQQLWIAPDGTDQVTVTVLAERWDSGT